MRDASCPCVLQGKEGKPSFPKASPGGGYFSALRPGKGKIAVFLGAGPSPVVLSPGCIARAFRPALCARQCPGAGGKTPSLVCCKALCYWEGTGTWPKWGPRGTATLKSNLWPGRGSDPCVKTARKIKCLLAWPAGTAAARSALREAHFVLGSCFGAACTHGCAGTSARFGAGFVLSREGHRRSQPS